MYLFNRNTYFFLDTEYRDVLENHNVVHCYQKFPTSLFDKVEVYWMDI